MDTEETPKSPEPSADSVRLWKDMNQKVLRVLIALIIGVAVVGALFFRFFRADRG